MRCKFFMTARVAILLVFCLVQASPVAIAAFEPTSLTYGTQVGVNVTTASTEVLAANTDRLWVLVINDSDTVIYCKVGAPGILNEPIRLNASGGSFEISQHFGNFTNLAINCIHGGAGDKVLLVIEVNN